MKATLNILAIEPLETQSLNLRELTTRMILLKFTSIITERRSKTTKKKVRA
jgi:hypothetical protein